MRKVRTELALTKRMSVSPEAVMRALQDPIHLGFAEPRAPRVDGGRVIWDSTPDVVERVRRIAEVSGQSGQAELRLTAVYEFNLPFFGWLFRPLVRKSLQKTLVDLAVIVEARTTGMRPPVSRRPVWAPPDRMSHAQSVSIATILMVIAIGGFCGSLFSQLVDYIARSFDASNADLGVVSSITRLGTFASIAGSVMADRRGRRRILLTSTAALSLVTLITAFSPGLGTFGALQVLSRGFVNLSAVVAFVALIEEASEGSRAYSMALGSLAGGAGYALGALLLPAADLSPGAWRFHFVLGGFGLLLLPSLARRLTETGRFAGLGARIDNARASEIVDRTYGGRFMVVAATGFLLNLSAAPFSQFMNRYLGDERGYSGLGILILRLVTQAGPALIAVWIGGRLAESRGRKPVARIGTIVYAFTSAAFLLGGGPVLWFGLLISTISGAIAGPSFATFTTEMFPTEVRGTAGAAVLGFAVTGSIVGLLLVGWLADPLGSVGKSAAITTVAPLLVALFLVPRLPEARGTLLDELSPPEV